MLSHKKPDSVINIKVEFGEGEGKVPLDNIAKRAAAYKPKERVTYKMIKEYIEAILQTARIYSNATRKVPGWRSAVGLYCKLNRCAV